LELREAAIKIGAYHELDNSISEVFKSLVVGRCWTNF